MKKIFKCLMIIVGTLVGAGFASGQEILSFFNQFSEKGVLGIVVASILFGVIAFFVIRIANDNFEYKDFIKNNTFLIYIIKSFTLMCFCIMISAIGTFARKEFNVPFIVGIIAASSLCFISFLFKFKGLEKINDLLVPIILVGIMLVFLMAHLDNTNHLNVESDVYIIQPALLTNWLQASILYVGYNSILLVPIILELRYYKLNKSDTRILSIYTALFLCITGLLIYYTLKKFSIYDVGIEMPMLAITKQLGNPIFTYYGITILFAIFTTAFSSGYAFLQLGLEKNYFKNCLLMCILSIAVAGIGFSNLVNICFPIFGYLGVIQIFYILLIGSRRHK